MSSSGLRIDNLVPGTSRDSNEITVSVDTNTVYGYSLSASVGQATDYNSRDLMIDNSYTRFYGIETDESLASLTADNTWGYAYRPAGSNTTWSNYSGLPLYSDTENVANIINTNRAADSRSIQFKIAARASGDQPAGEYRNVINFYAVAKLEPQISPIPCESRHICYNTGVLNRVEGTMVAGDGEAFHQIDPYATSATLVASNYSREGYGFAGWNDKYDYSGTYYGPNEDITFTADQYADEGLSVYAVWVKSVGSMQDDYVSVCNSLTPAPVTGRATMASVSALTDLRDNQTYAIARLADGHCWMIENLRLEGKYTRSATQIGQAQGYASSSSTGHGDFIGLAEPETNLREDAPLLNSLYYSGSDQSYLSTRESIGEDSRPTYRFPRYSSVNSLHRTTMFQESSNYLSVAGTDVYGYGNYYTFPAAVASTENNENDGYSFTTTSICPNGWRLPTSGNQNSLPNSDFNRLTRLVMHNNSPDVAPDSGLGEYSASLLNNNGDSGHKALRRFPNNFILAGNRHNQYNSARGSEGSYWSSTVRHYFAYYLNLYGGSLAPSYSYIKPYGFPVRCMTN